MAYDTQTGIPYNSIVLDTLEVQNPTWTRRSSTLSEFGSEQLEFAKLSMHSGNPIYNEKAESVIQYLYEKYPEKVKPLACKKWLPAYSLLFVRIRPACDQAACNQNGSQVLGLSLDLLPDVTWC